MKGIATSIAILVVIIAVVAGGIGYYVGYMIAKPEKAVSKIYVVSDIGGRGDLSFNDMAFKGGEEAEEIYGVEMVELISTTVADYLPNLRTAARDPDTVLVVGVGYLLTDAFLEVAQEYPDKNFAGIDTFTYWAALDAGITPPPNMMDIVYEEHKGSALVGALGALLAIHYDKPHIGGVFGIEIPVLWKFEIAYKWGAEWAVRWYESNYPSDYAAEPSTSIVNTATDERVLYTYTGTFSDITKGYEAASAMYDEDAVAVYNIAGPLGLGINQAVDEIATAQGLTQGPPFWIGVDANQDWINPGFVISSMMKRVDFGVTRATELVRKGLFRDVIEESPTGMLLGIGTEVAGIPMEGISVSTLADLDEFIEMGVAAEERTGESVLPMSPDQIRSTAAALRAAQPDWIWTAVGELKDKIRAGNPIADLDGDGELETVPAATTQDAVDSWRAIFG